MIGHEKISFFLPVRNGSERVKNKNTRPFGPFAGGLVENKLLQLRKSALLDEVILSTNDEKTFEIAEKFSFPNLKVVLRPEELCTNETDLQDLIAYAATVVSSPHILWGHVTNPFVTGEDYDRAIECYFLQRSRGYDSLVGGTSFRNYLLNEQGTIINNKAATKWPRTQDLELLFEINHAVFITSRQMYIQKRDRLGKNIFQFEMDKIKSFDIDWEDDFNICELLMEKLLENHNR